MVAAFGGSNVASASAVRACGDVPANHPRAGAFNVTARVARCEVARGVATRWYFRNQHHPFGYRCRVRTTGNGHDVRCTARGGRVVRFQYFISP